MKAKLTEKEARSVIQNIAIFADHITADNLAEYRIEIQRRLDLIINNFFGPENEHMTELLFNDDISLYTGKTEEKGTFLFGTVTL